MASPERLDTMVAVTKPKGWIALLAFCLLIVELLVWSIFGSLSLTVSGQGIFIRDRVIQVEAGADGRVVSLVPVGGTVVEGTIIAELDLSSLAAELDLERARLSDLVNEDSRATPIERSNLQRQLIALNDEKSKLPQQVEAAREILTRRTAEYDQGVQNLKAGLITPTTLNGILANRTASATELQRLETRLRSIDAELGTTTSQTEEKIKARLLEIDNLKRKVNQMEASLASGSTIRASGSGTILEHSVSLAEIVNPKSVLMTIEPSNTDMVAVVFVAAEEAKKIPVQANGSPFSAIKARLNPSTVKAEEYGFMLGQVKDIAAFPSTPEGMKALLRNDALVQQMMEKGPPIQVRTTLDPDTSVYSGFRWSSSKGPRLIIASGTLCKATFEVERRRPISYVIPAFKKTLGIQ